MRGLRQTSAGSAKRRPAEKFDRFGSLTRRLALMRPVPKLVQKAGRTNSNRSDTYPDAKRRTHAKDYPANASADYSERNDIGEHCVDHHLSPFNSRQPKTCTKRPPFKAASLSQGPGKRISPVSTYGSKDTVLNPRSR